MRKCILMLVAAFLLCAFGCSCLPSQDTEPTPDCDVSLPSVKPTAEAENDLTPSPAEACTEAPSAEPVPDETELAASTSFIGALSDEQKEDIMEYAAAWYSEFFADYEVLSMKYAEDDDPGYSYYAQYKPGELIILKVETTHGGRGVFRDCFIIISESGFNVINEGY